MPRRKTRSVRIPPPLEDELERAAKEESRSVSNVIVLAIQAYLKQRPKSRAA